MINFRLFIQFKQGKLQHYHKKQMIKVIILVLLSCSVFSVLIRHRQEHNEEHKQNLATVQQSHLNGLEPISTVHKTSSNKQSHKYWFNKHHPTDFILSSARQWNYCDYKCLYLQKFISNKDFVVVVMGGFLKEDFSACYVKNGQDYTLWKDIMTNKFYEENCGQDTQDWMKSGQFNIKGIYGAGIGTNLNQSEIYK